MRNARKWLSVLLALVFACLPQMTLPAQAAEEYNIWIGGVRVDSSNAGDVLGDGTVVFTPASGSEQARLTLNNAAIPGAARPDAPNSTAGIYAGIDLTLELVGSSEITGTDAISSSFGILLDGKTLTVTGSGTLDVTAGDGSYSCAISTNSMIMRSGTIRATAGKASDESEGVYSNSFTMEGGTLVATGSEAPKSWGVGGIAAVNGGVVIAGGQARAFWREPDLSGYADPDVLVNTEPSETGAKEWNGTDALGGDGSSFKYVSIESAGYDVWVGGVRVTEENKADVLGDGTVAFTPATESEQAKLTLNGAEIIGAPVPAWPHDSDGIYSDIDLTLELHGENTVTADNAGEGGDCIGIFTHGYSLVVTGDGILNVTAGEGGLSCGVNTFVMTMRSGTLRVTAGKATKRSSGVYSLSFTMEGGTLIAEAGEAPFSYGIEYSPTINGGTVVATGQTRAFNYEPDLSGYADPDVRVNTEADYPQYAEAWNGTDDLGGDGSSFQCVIIEPAGYDLWVGGVRVTEANKADVLGDGTVAFTPATESEQAKLTLNNADISGEPVPAWPHDSDGIYSDIDLTLELHGENTVTANDAWEGGDCLGIFAGDCSLIVTGDGILNVTTGEGRLSCGVDTFVLTMHSGTLRVTAGKATETSDGVYSLFFTMEGGTLITEAGEAPNSRGFDCISTFNGGTIEATGQSSALYIAPKLSGDAAPAVMVNTEPTEIGAKAWNGTDDLSKDGSFKYVKIARYNPFTDVAEGAYYYDAVLWAVEHDPQITKGTDATHFSPDATCTRGQVVTFLWRAAGAPEPTMALNPFSDVKEGAFYYKAVLWAVQNGITNGVDATHFGPDRDCTRGQVDAFLHRAQGTPAPGSDVNPFVDVKEGAFYYDAVLWAVEKNVTKGTSETTFSPDATCTRGQIVTFLYRAMK